jgi:Family of unknown function (DUF6515)
MKARLHLMLVAFVTSAALLASGPVAADPPYGSPPKGRPGNAHYYPPPGHVVRTLPRGYHESHHYHDRYYYYSGVWYRPYGAYYRVVAPPVGLSVSLLPDFYSTLWYGDVPYYYANSVYYTPRVSGAGYVVTEAPSGAVARTETAVGTAGSDEIFVYPRQSQSEATLARDRYECHRWAVSQTGFDPSQPGGGLPDSQYAAGRSDYRRAITACLEARGYTVR